MGRSGEVVSRAVGVLADTRRIDVAQIVVVATVGADVFRF